MNIFRKPFILPLIVICIIACSSDDDKTESVSNEIAAPIVNGKRLIKIKQGDTYMSLEYNSQDQVCKVKHHSKDGTVREDSYWYEDRRIIWSPLEAVYYFTNGRAVECNYSALVSDESEYTVDCKDIYTFDGSGYLIRATMPDLTEDEPIEEIYTYTWQNGNISSVFVSDSNGEMAPWEYNIRYTSIENNIPFFFIYFYSVNTFLEWQGCFGKRCKNLPESVTFINQGMEPSWDGYSITYTYNYTLEDGVITKISVKSVTNKGTSSQDVYELEWW